MTQRNNNMMSIWPRLSRDTSGTERETQEDVFKKKRKRVKMLSAPHLYTYGRSMLIYSRNQHNIVIILQLKIIFKKKLKKKAGKKNIL